eukprot:sb/3470191/
MSLTLPSLGKQTVVEEALLKKMAQLHNKRRQLKERKEAEEKAKLAEQRKPVTMSKAETILAAKRVLQADAAKKAEKEKNKLFGFKKSAGFERNRGPRRKEIRARPLTMDDSPERPSPSKKPRQVSSEGPGQQQSQQLGNSQPVQRKNNNNQQQHQKAFKYFDHDKEKSTEKSVLPLPSATIPGGNKYPNFVSSSNTKRKVIQYDDSLDIH